MDYIDLASSREIPIILKALVSMFASSAIVEAGEPTQRGEQYSMKLRMKAVYVSKSSGVPRKDFIRWKMPSW